MKKLEGNNKWLYNIASVIQLVKLNYTRTQEKLESKEKLEGNNCIIQAMLR